MSYAQGTVAELKAQPDGLAAKFFDASRAD
jgi:hypothetical protein